jgi:hypothetical protein
MDLTKDELRAFVEDPANAHLISRKTSLRYPGLYVLKYKKKVFFKNLWDSYPLLTECRGLIVDEEYNPVVRPFQKIFNYTENGTTIPLDEEIIVSSKINGFLGVVTNTEKYRVIYSTTGSTDSKFADMVKKYTEHFADRLEKGYTYLFEIVDPTDPHIISEIPGAYLIGIRNIVTGELASMTNVQMTARILNVLYPISWKSTFGKVFEKSKKTQTEGYVIYGKDTTLKLKTNFYLVSKLLGRMSEERLTKVLVNGQSTFIDEDYQFVLDELRKDPYPFIQSSTQGRIDRVYDIIDQRT